MAKTSGRTPDIRSLLTSAEKKLLDGTLGASLAAASKQELEALRKQARTLRDKWQDLFKRQTVTTKRKPISATNQANTRSREKSDLFSDAVKRLEARLAKLADAVTAPARGVKASRTAAARTSKKPARQAAHRATRATIREELSGAVAAINEAARKLVGKATDKKAQASKPAPAVAKSPTAAPADPGAARVPTRRKKGSRKPVTSKKARQAGKLRALTATGTGQAIAFDVKKQRSAKARATIARLKVDGEATRRKGFVVSNTKRKQARRDSR